MITQEIQSNKNILKQSKETIEHLNINKILKIKLSYMDDTSQKHQYINSIRYWRGNV